MKKIAIPAIAVFIIIITAVILLIKKRDAVSEGTQILIKKGTFISDVTTSGELQARNSVFIQAPSRLMTFGIYQLTISRMVDEGTVVKKGDWVADLDRSEFNTKLQDTQLDLEKQQSTFLQTKLDTTLEMRKSRDDIINLKYAVEQARLTLDQSKYEPPATIKQDEYELEKAERNYVQAKENYKIKIKQNIAKMQEVNADLQKDVQQLRDMQGLADQFSIRAPEDGMVIYTKSWDNSVIKTGSQVWVWNPTVATLPDMSSMISKTYINEVDVRKVKPGQQVEVGLDAFPDKQLTGTVISVANVGEQRPNSDAKVFEAIIQIDGTDNSLRPTMTTSNHIIVREMKDVISIPLECLHAENDSVTYVFRKSGLKIAKQEVEAGPANNSDVVILKGLKEGDRIYSSVPEGNKIESMTYLPALNGKRHLISSEVPAADNVPGYVDPNFKTQN